MAKSEATATVTRSNTNRIDVLNALKTLGGKGVPMTKLITACAKKGISASAVGRHVYKARTGDPKLVNSVKHEGGKGVEAEELTLTKDGEKAIKAGSNGQASANKQAAAAK